MPQIGQISVDHKSLLTALLASGAAISAYVYWTRCGSNKKIKRKPKLLTEEELQEVAWEGVGSVTNLWLYPVKSCSGVALQRAEAQPLGLTDGKVRDRSFACITEKGTVITGSMVGGTVLVRPVISDNTLVLKYSGVEDLTVNLSVVEAEKKEGNINIFGTHTLGLDCGDTAAQWLEKVFKKKARLLYHSNIPSPRTTHKEAEKYLLMKDDDNPLYANDYPYLLMTKESVSDLQSRVNCPAPAQNFRPNILVEGIRKAFDEDDWAYIKIGDAIFRNIYPCARCSFTTVNYETGCKEANMEPLRTLRTYRSPDAGKDPHMGINLALHVAGKINNGDEVFVTRFSKM